MWRPVTRSLLEGRKNVVVGRFSSRTQHLSWRSTTHGARPSSRVEMSSGIRTQVAKSAHLSSVTVIITGGRIVAPEKLHPSWLALPRPQGLLQVEGVRHSPRQN